MLNIVNSISTSLISAHTHIKTAETAVGVYESAKARGDRSVMERALSYASPAIGDAMRYSNKIDDDVRKALRDAREENERIRERERDDAGEASDTVADEIDRVNDDESACGRPDGNTGIVPDAPDNGISIYLQGGTSLNDNTAIDLSA